MVLKVFGSSSKGNGYALVDSQGNTLILECGVRYEVVQQGLDFNVGDIVGALVTHGHLDHSKYVKQYMSRGINVYGCSKSFVEKKEIYEHHRWREIGKNYRIKTSYRDMIAIDPFFVLPFEVEHDVFTLGFMISHPEMGNMVFATDTYYFPYTFNKVSHWVVEANYDKESMDEKAKLGEENIALRNRIVHSHMSIDNLVLMLEKNDLAMTKNIILCHLSDRNSHELKFIDKITESFGVKPKIADPGKEFNLDLNPF